MAYNEEPNADLYKKIYDEQETYRDWLLSLPSERILNHAYEYATRQDILFSVECNDLTDNQAKALLKSPCPLAERHHNTRFAEEIS